MYIPELDRFEPQRAVGILSRMILDIESSGLNPAATPLNPDENLLRESILQRAKSYVSQAYDNSDQENLERHLIEMLENEADARAEPVEEANALERLASERNIPSDALVISFHRSIRWTIEEAALDDRFLVPVAIHKADLAENKIVVDGELVPGLGVYGKYFNFGSDQDKFLLLAFGVQEGLEFIVSHFLRIYVSDVNLTGVQSPVEALRRFTNKYAVKIRVQEWSGTFSESLLVKKMPVKSDFLVKKNESQIVAPDKKSACLIEVLEFPAGASGVMTVCLAGLVHDKFVIAYVFATHYDKYRSEVMRHIRREKLVFAKQGTSLVNKLIK